MTKIKQKGRKRKTKSLHGPHNKSKEGKKKKRNIPKQVKYELTTLYTSNKHTNH